MKSFRMNSVNLVVAQIQSGHCGKRKKSLCVYDLKLIAFQLDTAENFQVVESTLWYFDNGVVRKFDCLKRE